MQDEMIYCYTRQDAINDGVFQDVTTQAKKVGFSIPVAITTNCYEKHIRHDEEHLTEQNINYFLSQVIVALWKENYKNETMFYLKIKANELDEENTDIWVAIEAQSPTDPSPAINVMLPCDY